MDLHQDDFIQRVQYSTWCPFSSLFETFCESENNFVKEYMVCIKRVAKFLRAWANVSRATSDRECQSSLPHWRIRWNRPNLNVLSKQGNQKFVYKNKTKAQDPALKSVSANTQWIRGTTQACACKDQGLTDLYWLKLINQVQTFQIKLDGSLEFDVVAVNMLHSTWIVLLVFAVNLCFVFSAQDGKMSSLT